uniref:Uncharacterized protein n=1 Tax=Arundo donax TaxID=35708 RepID=A0A0A9DXT1_ARUDO
MMLLRSNNIYAFLLCYFLVLVCQDLNVWIVRSVRLLDILFLLISSLVGACREPFLLLMLLELTG